MNNLFTHREASLIGIAAIILINGLLIVILPQAIPDFRLLGYGFAVIAAFWLVHIMLRKGGHAGDPYLLPLAMLLVCFGLIMILRLKPHLFPLQVAWTLMGLAVFFTSAFIGRQIQKFAEYKYLFGLVGVILLLATILLGVDIGGNKNWIILGPVRFQPSEFAKLFIVFFLAAYLVDRRELLTYATQKYGPIEIPHIRFLGPLIGLWGLTMLMLVMERDLGSALLFFSTFIIMAYLASGRISYFWYGVISFLFGAVLCYYLFPHVQARVDIWLHPWNDPNGRSFQIVQSLFALGSGGILGTGLTYGFPDIIPEVHTDFIFAAVGEELGLAGTAAVLISYLLLIYRGFRAAMLAQNPFAMLFAAGLSVFFSLQVFLIVSGVTKFLPLTGITLPFISYGGSSIVSNFILLGSLMAVSEREADDV